MSELVYLLIKICIFIEFYRDAVLPGTEEDISAVLLLQANIAQICNKSEDFRSEALSNARNAIMEL